MLRKRRSVDDEPFFLIRTGGSDAPAGTRSPRPEHASWHQLICVSAGLLAVDTDRGSWLAPPSWAVWAPAGAAYMLRFIASSSLRQLYIRPDPALDLPTSPCALAVSPLLRELMLRTVELGMLDARDRVEASIAALILAELGRAGPPPFALPQPVSAMTRQAAQLLASDTADSLAAVARTVGLGVRTLERRFQVETGLTPGRWRQQRKLMASLELIASGERVKTAAARAGFGSASAYVAAFRKLFGATPARYFAPR
jgi:AraC-like DNA-binding protein